MDLNREVSFYFFPAASSVHQKARMLLSIMSWACQWDFGTSLYPFCNWGSTGKFLEATWTVQHSFTVYIKDAITGFRCVENICHILSFSLKYLLQNTVLWRHVCKPEILSLWLAKNVLALWHWHELWLDRLRDNLDFWRYLSFVICYWRHFVCCY